mgnify:CR=1
MNNYTAITSSALEWLQNYKELNQQQYDKVKSNLLALLVKTDLNKTANSLVVSLEKFEHGDQLEELEAMQLSWIFYRNNSSL